MMLLRGTLLFIFAALSIAGAATAQQRPIFDPDDFVDPAQLGNRVLFVSRFAVGVVGNFVNDYRPLNRDVGFLYVANGFYWNRFQFDYKHGEMKRDQVHVTRCDCPGPVYFPTPPPPGATPDAPPKGSQDSLHFAFYVPIPREGRFPVYWRFRGNWYRQQFETVFETKDGQEVSRNSGKDQSFGLDADIFVPISRRDLYGSLHLARTETTRSTLGKRSQTEFVYVNRFPGYAFPIVVRGHDLGPLIVRAKLGVGGVTNRDGTALNLVNPTFEAFYHHAPSRANLHLIYSPVSARSGLEGWKTTHQVAFFVDRGFVKVFHLGRE